MDVRGSFGQNTGLPTVKVTRIDEHRRAGGHRPLVRDGLSGREVRPHFVHRPIWFGETSNPGPSAPCSQFGRRPPSSSGSTVSSSNSRPSIVTMAAGEVQQRGRRMIGQACIGRELEQRTNARFGFDREIGIDQGRRRTMRPVASAQSIGTVVGQHDHRPARRGGEDLPQVFIRIDRDIARIGRNRARRRRYCLAR